MSIFPDYNSPAALKDFLEARGMGMRKKFGQNFLVNEASRERLLDSLGVRAGDRVWEVGPGLGAMTRGLVERDGLVTAFEIDKGFSAVLRELFAGESSFRLVEGDVLKTWKKEALSFRADTGPLPAETVGADAPVSSFAPLSSAGAAGDAPLDVPLAEREVLAECGAPPPEREDAPLFFGNLPYNIAAALIADFITGGFSFARAVVTVQKEVAVRMAAKPGSADYSSFSVLCARFYDMKTVADLAPGNFWPRPNVFSRAVRMERKRSPAACADDRLFFALVRALFASRRKTVKNNLSVWLAPRVKTPDDSCGIADFMLQYAEVSPGARAETLSPEMFCALADAAVRAGVSAV